MTDENQDKTAADVVAEKDDKIEFKFFPKEMFEWYRETRDDDGNVVHRELIGQYWPGMSYNCTSKPLHDALRAMCKVWLKRGRIEIVPLRRGEKFVMNKT